MNMNIRLEIPEDMDKGGYWVYEAYTEKQKSKEFTPITWEKPELEGENPEVDTSDFPDGFHHFVYTVGIVDFIEQSFLFTIHVTKIKAAD